MMANMLPSLRIRSTSSVSSWRSCALPPPGLPVDRVLEDVVARVERDTIHSHVMHVTKIIARLVHPLAKPVGGLRTGGEHRSVGFGVDEGEFQLGSQIGCGPPQVFVSQVRQMLKDEGLHPIGQEW